MGFNATGTKLTIVRGDDYSIANGQSLNFPITNRGDLVGCAAYLRISGQFIDLCASHIILTGTQSVIFYDANAATTNQLPTGVSIPYQVRFVNTSNLVTTVINGEACILPGYYITTSGNSQMGTVIYQGVIDASSNPSYPPASEGWLYLIGIEGKLGGSGGVTVRAGDQILCVTTNIGGIQSSVGTSWTVISGVAGSVVGALLAANNLSDVVSAATSLSNLGGAPSSNPTFTGTISTPSLTVTGLTGAVATSRYVGATASGAPTVGTFLLGDFIIDQTGKVWICTAPGSPGTWAQVSGGGGGSVTGGNGITVSGSSVAINTAITVDKTTAQTLTNKTLTSPVITTPTGIASTDISGIGSIATHPTSDFVASTAVGSANGVASLDSGGKLPSAQLPNSVVGAVVYQGTWNANTNTPTLTSSTGTKGFYYKVSVSGVTSIDGINSWIVGDEIIFDGATWDKIDGNPNEVVSVAGRTGSVVIAESDVTGLVTDLTNRTLSFNIVSKTSTYTVLANDFVLANISGGSISFPLPTAPANNTRVGFKLTVLTGNNTVTYTCGGSDHINTASGPTNGTLTLLNQAVQLTYNSSTAIWTITGDDLTLSQLDARYTSLAVGLILSL